MSFQFSETFCLKNRWKTAEQDTWHRPLTSTRMSTSKHAHTLIWAQTCTIPTQRKLTTTQKTHTMCMLFSLSYQAWNARSNSLFLSVLPLSYSKLSVLLSIWRKYELLSGLRILQVPFPNNQKKNPIRIWSMSKSITVRGCCKWSLWMPRAFLANEQMSKNKNLNSDHRFLWGLLKRWPSLK